MSGHPEYPYPVKKIILPNHLEIAYMDVGRGDITLTFVHGFASYAPIWEKNLAALSKYYRCIALDLPGHGLSSAGDYSYSIDFYAQTIQEVLDQLAVERTVLIGHSMGGQICTHLALTDSRLFSHLILIAPAGFEVFSPTEKLLLQQFTGGGMISPSSYLQWILNLRNYFYEWNEAEYAKLQAFNHSFYTWRDNTHLPKVLGRSVKAMTEEAIFEHLSELDLPTLVLFGKNDQLIPNKFLHPWHTTEEIAIRGTQQIKFGKLKIYDRCGHFLPYEQAARFHIDLYKFLNPRVFRDF
ncbi:MAG: alpha/beta hydrolase [Microscillaceae bacterium]|jgi:pimeloyl-ACP methyl ester carboxylesterase|nr:alpha/beta hydrolase [Microscillaceae bacterium]